METAKHMIKSGMIKYYIKPDGARKEWIISEDAMYAWFGDKKQ